VAFGQSELLKVSFKKNVVGSAGNGKNCQSFLHQTPKHLVGSRVAKTVPARICVIGEQPTQNAAYGTMQANAGEK
jgi:hypothetical protein